MNWKVIIFGFLGGTALAMFWTFLFGGCKDWDFQDYIEMYLKILAFAVVGTVMLTALVWVFAFLFK